MRDVDSDDEAWLAALAGSQTHSQANKQASQLREYFTKRTALELDEPLDDASHTRAMNYLRARGAFSAKMPARSATPTQVSLWLAVKQWLFSSHGGTRARYALITSLTIAVVAVPLIVTQIGGDDDALDRSDIPVNAIPKGSTQTAPPTVSGSAKAVPSAPDIGEITMLISSDPARLATEIQSVLMARGITAHIGSSVMESTLTATISQAQLSAVAQDLQVYGISVPVNGHLRLSIRKS